MSHNTKRLPCRLRVMANRMVKFCLLVITMFLFLQHNDLSAEFRDIYIPSPPARQEPPGWPQEEKGAIKEQMPQGSPPAWKSAA